MNRCASVRKKGSEDQCISRALIGHTLCGRHARMKTPVLWTTVHQQRYVGVARIQACVRGWLVRMRLRLAGPGVLSRTNLANDDDLVTCESKDRQHPMEYFAFVENGKVWWFDFGSLWRWAVRSHEPVNPYTKVPLSTETRRRLRDVWAYHHRHRIALPDEPPTFGERLRYRWNVLVQIFVDNGFVDVHPNQFLGLNRDEYVTAFTLLHQDLLVVLRESDLQRDRLLRYCRRGIAAAAAREPGNYILQSSYILLLLLTIPKDPYVMVFSVLSALYRC